ncbi:hypothetical protein FDECE_16465 [Fusarium decemcellulare]|nr:hypothetical protein FDECE_16465 [Fusarium decemcellulare]
MTMPSLFGEFRDGPFVGLGYRTPTYTGVTDGHGRFFYEAGDLVTFFIGPLQLGCAKGAPTLTIASLDNKPDTDLFRPTTVNRARFLLSFSPEPDFRNGVTISEDIRDAVSKHMDILSFDSEIDSFEKKISVHAVFNELGARFRGVAEVRNHLRRSLNGIKLLRDVQIPTRDGSWLGADVFLPIGSGPSPTLMNMSVYGRAFRVGVIRTDDDLHASEEREDAWHENKRDDIPPFFKWSEAAFRPNASTWVPRGYVMVRVDHRGIGNTPGELNPYSKQEALDYYDAIEWAAKQPWSNGKVATFGASFHGTNQLFAAGLHPPSLKAIAALACDADAYRDLSYPGGIYLEGYRKYWWQVLVGKQRNPESSAVGFLEGLKQHPWDDEYYHGEGLMSADFSNIVIPAILSVSQSEGIHGRAGFEAFRGLGSPSKHLLVWDAFYMPSMTYDSDADLRSFFDLHLKGIKPAQEQPPVRLMMRVGDRKFEWRDAADWPIPGTQYQDFFLDANASSTIGSLSAAEPKYGGFIEYSADADPTDHENAPMAVFESAPFDTDVDFAGHFKATLWVASTSSDADIYVSLRVMDGERQVPYRTIEPATFQGEARGHRSSPPLTAGVLKASRRALDPTRSTPERPWHTHLEKDAQLLIPDKPVKVEVELLAVTGRVSRGWRLRLEVSPVEGPGTMPGFERAYDESYHRGAVNRVMTGGAHKSCITMPVVPSISSSN